MSRTIAVTTDFSSAAAEAFAAAAALARRREECVSILHVVDDPQIFTEWQVAGPVRDDESHRDTCTRLQQIAANDPSFTGLEVRAKVLCGGGPAAVGDFQAHEDVDLLIVASSGSGLPGGPPLGGFAARVVHLVDCPVLVFRSGRPEAAHFSRGAFQPRRILVPHDFSEESLHGVDLGREWAREFGAEMRLIHAVDAQLGTRSSGDPRPGEPPTPGPHDRAPGPAPGGHQPPPDQERQKALERLRATVAEKEPSAEEDARISAAVRVGNPVLEILLEARAWEADLIAIASRGVTSRAGVPVGSVTERVIEAADCPVLVVKRQG